MTSTVHGDGARGGASTDWSERAKAIYVFANEKGGMQGIDQEAIHRIILETSGNSAYTAKQLRSDAKVDESVARLRRQLDACGKAQRAAARDLVATRSAAIEEQRRPERVCVVIDFDMFYAAVEIRDRPELAACPVAVGGPGMISTANYVARRWGVRSAMPGFVGQALCRRGPEFGMPRAELVFVKPDFAKYTAVAEVARDIWREYDPHMRAASLDEAYLDLSHYLRRRLRWGGDHARARRDGGGEPDGDGEAGEDVAPPPASEVHALAAEVVAELRARVEEATRGLTTSAGYGSNWLVAKIASDARKPNGQYSPGPARQAVLDFLGPLPVRKLPGVGRVMEKMLGAALGIKTCAQLLAASAEVALVFSAGTSTSLLRKALGCTDEAEEAEGADAPAAPQKGISCERTFRATADADEQRRTLSHLCDTLAEHMAAKGLRGRKVTLKLKTDAFDTLTRDVCAPRHVATADEIRALATPLLERERRRAAQQAVARAVTSAASSAAGGSAGGAAGDAAGGAAGGSGARLRLRLMGVRVAQLEWAADSAAAGADGQRQIRGFLRVAGEAEEESVEELEVAGVGAAAAAAAAPCAAAPAAEAPRPCRYQQLAAREIDAGVLAELPSPIRNQVRAEVAAAEAERVAKRAKVAPPPPPPPGQQQLQQRLLSAYVAPLAAGESEVAALVEMGFSEAAAHAALRATANDIARAAERLLGGRT